MTFSLKTALSKIAAIGAVKRRGIGGLAAYGGKIEGTGKVISKETGKVTEFVIELHPTGSIIEQGNILEVMVMAPTMAPEPIGGWGFAPAATGVNTIHMSPRHPSHVLLPVIPPGTID